MHCKASDSTIILGQLLNERPIREWMAKLNEYHPPTQIHSFQVGFLSIDMGLENNMSPDQAYVLGYAGLLHDIGKLRVPLDILDKDTWLTSEEMAVMEEHPRHAFNMLEGEVSYAIRQIIVGHHEYQPNSYPRISSNNHQSGDDRRTQPDPALERMTEIVAIADMTESLTSIRAYKAPVMDKEQLEDVLSNHFKGDIGLIGQVVQRYV
jgi:hypothetical protein